MLPDTSANGQTNLSVPGSTCLICRVARRGRGQWTGAEGAAGPPRGAPPGDARARPGARAAARLSPPRAAVAGRPVPAEHRPVAAPGPAGGAGYRPVACGAEG